jgi:type IV secretion system protein VirD4
MTGWKTPAVIMAGLFVALGWFTHPALTVSLLVALLILTGAGAWWRHRRAGSAALVHRWATRAEKLHGVASPWMVLRSSSWWTARRQAKILLPRLRDVSFWTRWRTPINELATHLIRVGWVWVLSLIKEHTLTFGAPQQGKSGRLSDLINRATGPVMAVSTGGDLVRNTGRIRAGIGPIYVFNPCNIGGLASTIGFNLLDDCGNPQTARERAHDLLAGTPMADAQKNAEWVEHAETALAALMHAAALGGKTMAHVQMWAADPDAAAPEVMHHLKDTPSPSVRMEAGQFFTLGRPRSSVSMTIMPALRWLADPKAAACAQTGSLDVEKFLADRGTIYLLAEKDGAVAPLVNAFAMTITRRARRIADSQEYERLDEAFTIVPDEAPAICPMDLPSLTSDMGKRNITFHICAQSLPQIQDRWGERGAGALLTNCASIFVFGGTKDPASLATFSTLIGERSPGHKVLTPDQFMRLPVFHAVLFRNGILPVVGKPPMVWNRRDYRATQRAAVWGPRWHRITHALTVRRVAARQRLVPLEKPMLALPVSTIRHTQQETVPAQDERAS